MTPAHYTLKCLRQQAPTFNAKSRLQNITNKWWPRWYAATCMQETSNKLKNFLWLFPYFYTHTKQRVSLLHWSWPRQLHKPYVADSVLKEMCKNEVTLNFKVLRTFLHCSAFYKPIFAANLQRTRRKTNKNKEATNRYTSHFCPRTCWGQISVRFEDRFTSSLVMQLVLTTDLHWVW